MPQPCKVCTHAAGTAIDSALLDGVSASTVADHFNVSMDSVHRHRREHLLTGRRPVPPSPATEDRLPPKTVRKGPATTPRLARMAVAGLMAEAVRKRPEGTQECRGEGTTGKGVAGDERGFCRGMNYYVTVKYLVGELFRLADDAGQRGEKYTQIACLFEIVNLTLRAARLWPDQPKAKQQDTSAQEEFKRLIREVLNESPELLSPR